MCDIDWYYKYNQIRRLIYISAKEGACIFTVFAIKE